MGILGLPLKCLESFLTNRFQRVLLNGQSLSWSPALVSMPSKILWALLFLVYINDLSENQSSAVKPFADDASIYSVAHDASLSLMQGRYYAAFNFRKTQTMFESYQNTSNS